MEDLTPELKLAFRGLPCKETVYISFSFQKLEQWEIQRDCSCLFFLSCCAVPKSELNKSFFVCYDVLLCVYFCLPNTVSSLMVMAPIKQRTVL